METYRRDGMMSQSISFQADISDELIDRIAERVIERLKPLLSSPPLKEKDIILDVKSLAEYLKTTEAWVRDQARNGNIPCFKSGKCWKFHKRQIDRLYQSRSFNPHFNGNPQGKSLEGKRIAYP